MDQNRAFLSRRVKFKKEKKNIVIGCLESVLNRRRFKHRVEIFLLQPFLPLIFLFFPFFFFFFFGLFAANIALVVRVHVDCNLYENWLENVSRVFHGEQGT